MTWQLVLDAQSAFTETLIRLVDVRMYEELQRAYLTCTSEYLEAFSLWLRENRPNFPAQHYPRQPGDDKPVGESNITWGQLFGRQPNPQNIVKRQICKNCGLETWLHANGVLCHIAGKSFEPRNSDV